MTRVVEFRGRRYWYDLSLRHGFIEFRNKRLVWHIFTVENKPPVAR